jgi:flagellar basal body rod protein FlgG
MLKGFYAAASAMVVGMNRQQVLAHNIANVDTPGFKQVLLGMQDYRNTTVVPPASPELPSLVPIIPQLNNQLGINRLQNVGQLGLGVMNEPEKIDLTQGAMRYTGESLDMAISGEGFFAVRMQNGTTQYTRDGRFLLNNGQLLTVDGNAVLDSSGQAITLEPGAEIAVDPSGQISVNGTAGPKIGLFSFTEQEKQRLVRSDNNTYVFGGATQPSGTERGQIRQKYIETSNANVTQIASQMVSTARAYEAAQNLVRIQDDSLARAITTLGRS